MCIPALFLLAAAAVPKQSEIDFSYAGYSGGGVSAPIVPAVIAVRPTGGDDTARLQAALDNAGRRPLGKDGFRGAVLLRPGRFLVGGQLRLRASGVVLRGSGNTTIAATGKGRRTLIEIGNAIDPVTDPPVSVADETVAAGAAP